ncbi:MAG: hemerythrin family protein [Comamonadaceae bacterium]|nr:hemerythrin family protein [Comamonadaceae bacterium]
MADLKAYTHYHFSTEEHMMREGGCPSGHMRLHLRQHSQGDFERSLDQFARAYNVSGAVVAGSLLEFLLKWLMSHIMGSDKEMGRLMRGEDAAPAADMSSRGAGALLAAPARPGNRSAQHAGAPCGRRRAASASSPTACRC